MPGLVPPLTPRPLRAAVAKRPPAPRSWRPPVARPVPPSPPGAMGARRKRGGAPARGIVGVMAAPRQRAAGWARWLCTAAAPPPRPWRLFGAMCLLRLPRITQPLEKEEEEMAALMGQVEGGAGERAASGLGGAGGRAISGADVGQLWPVPGSAPRPLF